MDRRRELHPPLRDHHHSSIRTAGVRTRAGPALPGTQQVRHLLLEIPADFQELRGRDQALALEWRLAVRAAFESAFSAGYAAVEFLRAGDRAAYLLVPQPRAGLDPGLTGPV